MKRILIVLLALGLIFAMSGCVSQKDYDALKSGYDDLQMNYEEVQADYEEIQADYEALLAAQANYESLLAAGVKGPSQFSIDFIQTLIDDDDKENYEIKFNENKTIVIETVAVGGTSFSEILYVNDQAPDIYDGMVEQIRASSESTNMLTSDLDHIFFIKSADGAIVAVIFNGETIYKL